LTALKSKGVLKKSLKKASLSKKSKIFSFRVNGSNNLSQKPEARLNQPQQYEATIN